MTKTSKQLETSDFIFSQTKMTKVLYIVICDTGERIKTSIKSCKCVPKLATLFLVEFLGLDLAQEDKNVIYWVIQTFLPPCSTLEMRRATYY